MNVPECLPEAPPIRGVVMTSLSVLQCSSGCQFRGASEELIKGVWTLFTDVCFVIMQFTCLHDV